MSKLTGQNLNLSLSLFSREIGKDVRNHLYQIELKKKVGIELPLNHNLKQIMFCYDEYYDYLSQPIKDLEELKPRDLIDFLCDKNLGQGELKTQLLKLLLEKPNAINACVYINSFKQSALSVAAELGDIDSFNLIKNKLLQYNNFFEFISHNKDTRRKTPLSYLKKANQIPKQISDYKDLLDCIKHDNAIEFKKNIVQLGAFSTASRILLKQRFSNQSTLLHKIASCCAVLCLDVLIKFLGDDISKLYIKNDLNRTPLFYAGKKNNLEIIKKLLPLSSFPPDQEFLIDREKSAYKFTVLDAIIHNQNLEIMHYILNNLNFNQSKFMDYLDNPYFPLNALKDYYSSAASFFVLSQLHPSSFDSHFIQRYEDMSDDIHFTLRIAIENHKKFISNDNRVNI